MSLLSSVNNYISQFNKSLNSNYNSNFNSNGLLKSNASALNNNFSIAGAVGQKVEKAASSALGLPPFDNIITVIVGIILVTLGLIFIGGNNKILEMAVK